MSAFTLTVIMGVLLVLAGIAMIATPLITFLSSGTFIIIMFFVWGVFGIIRGILEKTYNKEFFFSILSLILGIIGLAVPGAAELNNHILLYLAAGWFLIHGVMTIMDAVASREKDGTGMMILRIILGILSLVIGGYSIAHPALAAINTGLLIGFYFIEAGVSVIAKGAARFPGGNSLTIVFVVIGVLTLIAGISMLSTPLFNFMSIGHCIIMLFFIVGIVGIVRAIAEHHFGNFLIRHFPEIAHHHDILFPGRQRPHGGFHLLDPRLAEQLILYLAAGWFIVQGVLSIIDAIRSKSEGAGTGMMILGIVLGALELILGIYSIAHPGVLALSLGLLVSFYFIETGIELIFLGSTVSSAVAIARDSH